MVPKLDRRALFRLGGAAAAVNLAALSARAQEPAKPTTPMPPIAAYGGAPSVSEIALSPDGSRCAVITEKGDQKYLMHFYVQKPAPKMIGMGQDKVERMLFGDNAHIVLVNRSTLFIPGMRSNRTDLYQARTIGLDSGSVNVLFKRNADRFLPIITGGVNRVKIKGEYQVTASNFTLGDASVECLYSFTLDKGYGSKLCEAAFYTSQWVVSPDGFVLAYASISDEGKTWSMFYNSGEPGKSRFNMVYNVSEALAYPGLRGIGRNGGTVVVDVPAPDAPDGNYYEVAADGALGAPLRPADDNRDYSAVFHPGTGRLAGFKLHDDWFSFQFSDPVMQKLSESVVAAVGEDTRASMVEFAEDPRKMILYTESASDAGSFYFADFTTGETQFLASNHPDIPEEWISQKTAIRYEAADGLEIPGYLTLPLFKAPKNLPLIVLPHGGPAARDHINFDWQAQVLASRGYAVLQPNFRGSTGCGRRLAEKGYGEWGGKMQSDLSDGVRWLAAQGTIDPKRVAIMGASYGGYAALAGATLDRGIYRCAISIAGISGLDSFLQNEMNIALSTRSRRVMYFQRFFGDTATYDARSPVLQATKADCPILLLHGTDDTVVRIEESRRMDKALRAAGKSVQFLTFEGQDHWETVGSARIEMMTAILAFLDQHNPTA